MRLGQVSIDHECDFDEHRVHGEGEQRQFFDELGSPEELRDEHVMPGAVVWYRRLGFEQTFEHRFEPHMPAYVGLRRDGAQIHLSEHAGDAIPNGLVYVWVDDVDVVAAEFGVTISVEPWGREIYLVDPDGNRLWLAESNRGPRTRSPFLGVGPRARPLAAGFPPGHTDRLIRSDSSAVLGQRSSNGGYRSVTSRNA